MSARKKPGGNCQSIGCKLNRTPSISAIISLFLRAKHPLGSCLTRLLGCATGKGNGNTTLLVHDKIGLVFSKLHYEHDIPMPKRQFYICT